MNRQKRFKQSRTNAELDEWANCLMKLWTYRAAYLNARTSSVAINKLARHNVLFVIFHLLKSLNMLRWVANADSNNSNRRLNLSSPTQQ